MPFVENVLRTIYRNVWKMVTEAITVLVTQISEWCTHLYFKAAIHSIIIEIFMSFKVSVKQGHKLELMPLVVGWKSNICYSTMTQKQLDKIL